MAVRYGDPVEDRKERDQANKDKKANTQSYSRGGGAVPGGMFGPFGDNDMLDALYFLTQTAGSGGMSNPGGARRFAEQFNPNMTQSAASIGGSHRQMISGAAGGGGGGGGGGRSRSFSRVSVPSGMEEALKREGDLQFSKRVAETENATKLQFIKDLLGVLGGGGSGRGGSTPANQERKKVQTGEQLFNLAGKPVRIPLYGEETETSPQFDFNTLLSLFAR